MPNGLQTPDPAGYFKGESMTRRTAFTIGVQAVGGIAVAAVALPAVGFAVAPLFEEESEPWQAVGATSDFDQDTYRPVTIAIVQGIGETGKSTAYVRQGNPEITANQSKYPPESPDEYIAISTRCAHVGCPVRFVQASGNFICPCHGGVYGFLGERIGGPPVPAPCASSGPRATPSARAAGVSPAPWASGSEPRRCDRSIASRRGSPTARSRSVPATASPAASSPFAPAIPASSRAASGTTSIRRGRPSRPRPSER